MIIARRRQGILLGQANAIGFAELGRIVNDIWVQDALATAAIEGEKLNLNSVRSSVMRQLGLGHAGPVDRKVDGLVEVMQDATAGFQTPLTVERLCRWQSALFPDSISGMQRIEVGRFRTGPDPMQIVGGPIGKETVYYTAPPASRVLTEVQRFLKWFEDTRPREVSIERIDGIVRTAIAHLWFETVHPFEDGNGRIGRAIVDLALAQDTDGPMRVYSVSRQLMQEGKAYYGALGEAQHGGVDVTEWIVWFLNQFTESCRYSAAMIEAAIAKSKFWSLRADRPLNERQRKVIQRMLDAGSTGFAGGISAAKYGNLTKASKATATRDLADLLQHEWVYAMGQGKATRYRLNVPEWQK